MRPANSSLVKIIREGAVEAQAVSLNRTLSEDETLSKFAGRMNMRLYWAAARIEELEKKLLSDDGW